MLVDTVEKPYHLARSVFLHARARNVESVTAKKVRAILMICDTAASDG